MAHNDVYVALRYAAVMHQGHAAVVRHAGHETFGRGAVMQEIAGETGLRVPLPQRAAVFEERRFAGRFHEMDRKRGIAPGSDRTQGGILHRIERMGGQRSLRMAEQRQQVLGRRGAQTEKLDESMVGDAAARFYGESGIPVRNIAYGFDPGEYRWKYNNI